MNHYGKNAKRQSVILAEDEYVEKLKTMISEHCFDELNQKLVDYVGIENLNAVRQGVAKALVEGNGIARKKILNIWLDMDSCRVCTTCGKIMEEGWYLNDAGYACSDECAAKSENISMDEFKRYQIYKTDIIEYLQSEGDTRDISELSDYECSVIIDKISGDLDWYWTEWY